MLWETVVERDLKYCVTVTTVYWHRSQKPGFTVLDHWLVMHSLEGLCQMICAIVNLSLGEKSRTPWRPLCTPSVAQEEEEATWKREEQGHVTLSLSLVRIEHKSYKYPCAANTELT